MQNMSSEIKNIKINANLLYIFEMLYDGKSQYAIAELIGKPQTTVNYSNFAV